MAKVGAPLVDIDTDEMDGGGSSSASSSSASTASPATSSSSSSPSATATLGSYIESGSAGGVLATPAVRRLSKENKIDLKTLRGTGKDGRVLKEDILAQINNGSTTTTAAPTTTSSSSKTVATSTTSSIATAVDSIIPLTVIQKAMYKQMTRSLAIPHFGYSDEIVMDECMALRRAINSQVDRERGRHMERRLH